MPDLGAKYECDECGARFYDLGRDEAICPKCGHDANSPPETESQGEKTTRATKKKKKKRAAAKAKK